MPLGWVAKGPMVILCRNQDHCGNIWRVMRDSDPNASSSVPIKSSTLVRARHARRRRRKTAQDNVELACLLNVELAFCIMTSAGRLCSVRVASAADIRSQVCDSDHFELIHDFQAVRHPVCEGDCALVRSDAHKYTAGSGWWPNGSSRQPCDAAVQFCCSHAEPERAFPSAAKLLAPPDVAQVELVLSLPDTTPLQEVRRLAAERLGAPPQGLRFWRWTERENGTYRPFVPVEDDVVLSVRMWA